MKAEPGETVFTSSGTFTIPKGIKEIRIFCVGGGGGGGCGYPATHPNLGPGSGGCSGFTATSSEKVTPNSDVSIIIGGGGTTTTANGNATCGNATQVSINENIAITALGSSGGSGGSAGGLGAVSDNIIDGCSDGSSVYMFGNAIVQGQGTTTRAFGESEGTLYAGGGGGGGWNHDYVGIKNGGVGGAGGGGNGGLYNGSTTSATAGSANTGGGGGGGAIYNAPSSSWSALFGASNGGSGIAIIRWGY